MGKIGNSLLVLLLLILLLISNVFPQRLWEIPEPGFEYFRNFEDTSVAALQQVIIDDESSPINYSAASIILAYFHESTQRQFLLRNLNTNLDSVSADDPITYYFQQKKYLSDQIIKGYLGDHSALASLDTFITISQFQSEKLLAMQKLAEAGVLKPEYYQFIKSSYSDSNYRNYADIPLVYYAKNPDYTEEVKDLFIREIKNATNTVDMNGSLRLLWWIEPGAAVNLLKQEFESHTGKERLGFFECLNRYDPKGQPKRSIWAIPQEPDEYIRSDYFPDYLSVEAEIFSRAYLTPEWINFILNWKRQETSDLITVPLGWFLYDFKPLPIDSAKPAINVIEELIQLVDTIYKYSWLGSKDFADMLKNNLMSAKTDFEQNQLLKCEKKVKSFQNIVDAKYQDSSSVNSNFVTKEGWKFLFYNAQYILDKLPALK